MMLVVVQVSKVPHTLRAVNPNLSRAEQEPKTAFACSMQQRINVQ